MSKKVPPVMITADPVHGAHSQPKSFARWVHDNIPRDFEEGLFTREMMEELLERAWRAGQSSVK